VLVSLGKMHGRYERSGEIRNREKERKKEKWKKEGAARFEVFEAVLMNTHIFWDMASRRLEYTDVSKKLPASIFKEVPEFNVHVYRKNILIYIQQDATLHSLFYLETALHVSGGTTTHHQERKQLYLQHLVFVSYLT
jgi:hypothetical protein